MISEETARNITLHLIERYDKTAVPHFDQMWADLSTDEEADAAPRVAHGFGGGMPADAWSLILIPLIGAIAKKGVDVTFDGILAWIREKRGRAVADDAEVATAVVQACQQATVQTDK
jgi:hypothetical protein